MDQQSPINYYEQTYKKGRLRFWVLAGLAMLIPVLALIVPFRPDGIGLPEWFARSGSAMVIVALLAEAKAVELFQLFKPAEHSGFINNKIKKNYYKKTVSFNETAFSIMATGTLVWGYGDLFIAWLAFGQ